jgi:hypothetical protein
MVALLKNLQIACSPQTQISWVFVSGWAVVLEIVHIEGACMSWLIWVTVTHAVVGLCRDETRTSEHIGISPAEEGWTVAHDNEMYLVAALTCNVLQQVGVHSCRVLCTSCRLVLRTGCRHALQ